MPFEIKLDSAPAGYALETAMPGERLRVVVRDFISSEDGELFISRLEGFPSQILGLLPPGANVRPSSVEQMIAVIWPDLHAKVYVDECDVRVKARSTKPIQAGEAVRADDIVDIHSLEFVGVEVPCEVGVVCLISSGWRKGLFFDFTPLANGNPPRDYDLWGILGSYFAYLSNQQVFGLDEAQWDLLFRQGWFPFVSLPKRLLRDIVSAVRYGSTVDTHLPDVSEAIRAMAPEMKNRWAKATLLHPHCLLLEHALEKFLQQDYVSATAILYPRIEGILRSMHAASGSASSLKPKGLAHVAVETYMETTHAYSWLLPQKFRSYLDGVYFANFTSGQQAVLSRHSVGHGIADARDFDQKHACVALLIVDQLSYLLPNPIASGHAASIRP